MSTLGFSVFNVVVNLVETFINIWFITRFFGYKDDFLHRRVSFVSAWMLSFACIQLLNSLFAFEGLLGFSGPLIIVIYAIWALKGRLLEKIFFSVVPFMCVAMINSVVGGLQMAVLKINVEELIAARSYKYVVCVIITKILLFLVLMSIIKLKKTFQELPDRNLWILFIVILLISIASVFFIYVTIYSGLESVENIYYLLGAVLGVVAMNVITFYFLKRIGKETELRKEIELLKQNAFYQEENVKIILQKQEMIRKMRHDMKNVMFAIQGMVEENRTEEVLEYFDRYMEQTAFRGSTSKTGLQSVDNLIIYKLNLARDYGIEVKSQTEPITNTRVEELHLCVVLGNLLDNAIEALKKLEDHRELELAVEQHELHIAIWVKNYIAQSVLDNNPQLNTTKEDQGMHGFGIRSVKDIVKQYGGMVDIYEEDSRFVFRVEI